MLSLSAPWKGLLHRETTKLASLQCADEEAIYLTGRLVRRMAPDLTCAEADDFALLVMKVAARSGFARAQWLRHHVQAIYPSKKLRGHFVPTLKREMNCPGVMSLRSGKVWAQPHGKRRGSIKADVLGDGEFRIRSFAALPVRDGKMMDATPELLSSLVDQIEAQGRLPELTYL